MHDSGVYLPMQVIKNGKRINKNNEINGVSMQVIKKADPFCSLCKHSLLFLEEKKRAHIKFVVFFYYGINFFLSIGIPVPLIKFSNQLYIFCFPFPYSLSWIILLQITLYS
jgi:hypothetical protein